MPIEVAVGKGKSRPKSLVTKGKTATEMLLNNLRFKIPLY